MLEHGRVIFDGDTDTAVRLYLERALGRGPVNVELSRMPHSVRGTAAVRMEHLTLAGKQSAIFACGEPLRMRLRVRAAEPIPDAVLRLTLRAETDQAVGTAWSKPVVLETGEQEFLFTLPMDAVVRGRFYASVGLYRPGEGRRMVQLDHVTRAFLFEVTPPDAMPAWSSDAYGPVLLGRMEGVRL